MKLGVKKLSSAVRLALSLGAVIAVGASNVAFAQDTGNQDAANQSSQKKAKTLQTVVVTGSLIRRVDVETSNPVITIDRAQIEATGKMTLGDLVQQLPTMTGGNVNPQVNNAGGTGGSSINLRGLGSNRTLLLVNGQRVVSTDPNAIPASAIDRIEVLTDGASATYGSDAIGGVVNFILKKDYQGAQFTANYGESDRQDGQQSGYSFTFGHTSDKGGIIGGIEYNKQDQIISGSRGFSKDAVSLYGTVNTPPTASVGGSSSSPYGHIQLPPAFAGLFPATGCGYVALNPGGNSQVVSPANYHCYVNSGPASDRYNYATVNLVLTPQERTNAFVMGTYDLSDNVSAYMSAYYNKTSSAFQLAPAVYGSPYGADVSVDNFYNPFGVEYKQGLTAFNARLVSAGNRAAQFGTTTGQVNTGFKGNFELLDQQWNWDVGLDYGHISQVTTTLGLPNGNKLYTGPSYMYQGALSCSATADAASSCPTGIGPTELGFNPFDLFSPGSVAALKNAAVPAISNQYTQQKIWHAGVNGGLFNLPAGTVQLAVGADYRQEHLTSIVDPLLQLDVNQGTCVLGSQCSSGLRGGYNVKEIYAEAFIPLLADMPGAQSLNLTVGDRYSRISTTGSTNNFKFALEWKPISDLLLRGTMAEVYRAPNINELYGAPGNDAPLVNFDPCDGYTGNPVNPACVGVPTDGSFKNQAVASGTQINAITAGSIYSGFGVKPEQGKSFDLGAVYSPSWAPGLSTTVDFWHVYLNDIITTVGAQSVINLCSAGQTDYCQFIHRFASGPNQGQFASNFLEPTGNLGSTSTGGVDYSLIYKLPQTPIGNFTVGLNATYLKYYNQQTAPGTAGNATYHNAGHFLPFGSAQSAACPDNAGVCLYPRWRGQGFVNWQDGGWSASWRMRYIGKFALGSPKVSDNIFPSGTCYYDSPSNPCTIRGAVMNYGATIYNDVSIGYNLEPLNTRVDFGVNNVFDKQPPIVFANNSLNANTDPSDFDMIGRYFWARVTVKF
jgi:Outer membrane cobalamin receptor protein